jgi:hypothetical protein
MTCGNVLSAARAAARRPANLVHDHDRLRGVRACHARLGLAEWPWPIWRIVPRAVVYYCGAGEISDGPQLEVDSLTVDVRQWLDVSSSDF